jgi:DNA polymerase-3 subunit beta
MKFTIQQKSLLAALSICSKGKGTSLIIPILDFYLFKIKKDSIEIIGSNQEIYISKTIEAIADEEINLAIPDIRELISKLDEQAIDFEVKNFNLTISWVGGTAKLVCEDGNLFPEIKISNATPVDISDFAQALIKTSFCISNNTATPFDGLSIDITEGFATFTAYGNNTLSTQKVACGAIADFRMLLPKNTAEKLSGLEINKIAYDQNAIDFIIDDTSFIRSVLLDLVFPDFKSRLALGQQKVLKINAYKMRNAVDLVRLMANKLSQFIALHLGQQSFASGADKEFATNAKQFLNGQYTGEDFVIGCNGQFLTTALTKVDGDIFLYFSDKKSPILIRENEDNSTLDNLIIVMPINI